MSNYQPPPRGNPYLYPGSNQPNYAPPPGNGPNAPNMPPTNQFGTSPNSNQSGPYSSFPPNSMPAGGGANVYAPPAVPGPPSQGLYSSPVSVPPTNYNNMNNAPPVNKSFMAPPSNNFGGPPTMSPPNGMMSNSTGNIPPPSNNSINSFSPAQPKPSVQFFSTSGGVPVPTNNFATAGPPPSNTGGFMAGNYPPPTNNSAASGMPPPPSTNPPYNMNAPPTMPPPPGMYPPSMSGVPPPYGTAPPGVAPMVPLIPNTMSNMPTGFDSGTNLASMNNPNGQNGAPSPDPNNGGAPLPLIEEMDLSIQCNPSFMRATVSKIVGNQAVATSSRIPLGLICKPMYGDKGTTNDEIEVVDFGSTGIVRCKRCRTYINPFVTWADNGRRWRCNICGMLNDVPSSYFSHLDNNGQRRDKDQRPELSRCSVEFVAPGDYMVRPPQPPVYFFVIDVSDASIASGMIYHCVNAIKASLDEMPGAPRTQIGFITFDSHIHFYNLKSSLTAPQMLVVPDITDVIMPLPEDLLVNLQESRTVVDALLDSLPTMFKPTNSINTCLGPALMAAKRVIQHLGGKLCVFQSSLPSLGEGALKQRDNPRVMGTDKEHNLLNAEDPWYKTNAIDFSRLQISVDTFLFSGQYTDLATISVLSKYTSGSTYYYPSFHGPRDGLKFEKELSHNLTRATAFEAVMRVRATRGLRFSNFYGNYFIRGTDLLALPNCTSDSTYALDMSYDETQLSAQAITIQAALLYTSSNGERRIRVHTMVLPVTNSASEMVESLDIDCAMNLLSKQAIDIALKTGMENARQRVHQTTIEIMRSSKSGAMNAGNYGHGQQQYMGQGPSNPAGGQIPNSLLLLPLYSMSLQKSLVLRGGSDVRIDERAYFQQLLYNMDIEESKVFIYPRMFSIHDMSSDIGVPSDNADDDCPTAGPLQVRLPAILNLSYERLISEGIFLVENGCDMFMWIGRNVNPAIISTLFGYQSLDNVDISTLAIQPGNSDFSSRVFAVVLALREDRARYMQLHFIREGDGMAEAYFARFLIEDRANFNGGNLSYTEFHSHVTRAISGLPG
eukprot:gene6349-8746_t